MKTKIIKSIAIVIVFIGCSKEEPDIVPALSGSELQSVLKPPPPSNANPAFAFQDYFTQGNRSIPAIYVMDVTGANKTRVYSNYNNQSFQTPDYPAWSATGTQLCFTLNSTDLYTLNIALVNGVPTGSGATKIGNGVAGGGNYKQGKWRPGQNEIACVWKKTGDPDKIHLLPSAGGSPSVLYTAGTGWIIEDDIAFKSDGSNLVFSERQTSTGFVYLKVLDVAAGQVIQSIDLSQYKSVKEIDWAKSSGNSTVAITTRPLCDTSVIGLNDIHQLHTVDVSSPVPSLIWLKNDVGNISYSPDDLQITINSGLSRSSGGSGCSVSQYSGMRILTIATMGITSPSYTGGNHHDWKR